MKSENSLSSIVCRLRRDILYIPVFEISAHIYNSIVKFVLITDQPFSAPLTLLWFEKTFFQTGHYQSNTPTDGQHHNETL